MPDTSKRIRSLLEVLPPPRTGGLPRNLQPSHRLRLIQALVGQPQGVLVRGGHERAKIGDPIFAEPVVQDI